MCIRDRSDADRSPTEGGHDGDMASGVDIGEVAQHRGSQDRHGGVVAQLARFRAEPLEDGLQRTGLQGGQGSDRQVGMSGGGEGREGRGEPGHGESSL